MSEIDPRQKLPPEMWQLIAKIAAKEAGLKCTFLAGSNPCINIHVHLGEGASMSETNSYTDQSSGPTGAKSFGEKASASNSGPVFQQRSEVSDPSQLLQLFEQLTVLMREVTAANPQSMQEACNNLARAASATTVLPPATDARTAWQKARAWLESALGVGLFAAAKAQEVKELVSRISQFFA